MSVLGGLALLGTPWALALLLAIPLFAWAARRFGRGPTIRYPSIELLKAIRPSRAARLAWILPALRYAGLSLLVVALARPQMGVEASRVTTEGRDILLAVDVSGSMAAEDFEVDGKRQNRLAVVKRVIREFVGKRKVDRIGLLVFSAEPYTLCPLTLDYEVVGRFLERAEIGMLPDGTAIGMAIAAGVQRLGETAAKSKALVLLTDGQNNAGKIDPDTAAGIAAEKGIRLYTVGAGTRGIAPFPLKDRSGRTLGYQRVAVDIDDEALTRVAEKTGGRYFRATDTETLHEIYGEIDRLEKTEIDVSRYYEYHELFAWLVLPGAALLGLALLLGETRFRRIP